MVLPVRQRNEAEGRQVQLESLEHETDLAVSAFRWFHAGSLREDGCDGCRDGVCRFGSCADDLERAEFSG
jgi:hypothetical protein